MDDTRFDALSPDAPSPPLLAVPARSLVALVGLSGAGKSTFAGRNFRETEVLSSDRMRALIADDAADQSVSAAAFDLLYRLASARLAAGKIAVVDATSVTREARAALLAVARAAGAPAVAIVLDVPFQTCVRNDALRPERSVGEAVVAAQRDELERTRGSLDEEGWDLVFVLDGVEAVSHARVIQS